MTLNFYCKINKYGATKFAKSVSKLYVIYLRPNILMEIKMCLLR